MRHLLFIGIALALVVGGCAMTGLDVADEPAAAVTEAVRPLSGHWQGTIWETASVYYQGSYAVDMRITDDGRWTGTIGRMPASGTARMHGRWLVLSGFATEPGGHQEPVFVELKGDENRRWGEIASGFAGRDGQGRVEHAQVSLYRMP